MIACAVQTETISKDNAGRVTRVTYDGRTTYHAAGRCIGNHRGDNFDYHVAVIPADAHSSCWTGYLTEQAAREAIASWVPGCRMHEHDHARALKG